MNKLLEAQVSALVRSALVEQALCGLYGEMALRIPGRAAFWQRLSADEAEHGSSLFTLAGLVEAGKLLLDVSAFNPDSVQSMVALIRVMRGQIHASPCVSHRQAAVLALALEGALVEQPVFTAIGSESDAFRRIRVKLRESTSSHIRALLDAAAPGCDV